MQKCTAKIICSFVLSLFYLSSLSASPSILLNKADSLFKEKKFTEAIQAYEELFRSGYFSEASLLKIAYVKEGVGLTGEALFYLYQYFLLTDDQTAYNKVLELAQKNNLVGYERTEMEKINHLVLKKSDSISGILAAVGLLGMALVFFFNRRGNVSGKYIFAFITLICMAMLFVQVNLIHPARKAIIIQSSTYLMSGPSAAAGPTALVNAGHMVDILDQEDVWVKVRWNEKIVFVKKDRVLEI